MPGDAKALFTILSAMSLVLCVATCVLWVRSFWVGEEIKYYYGDPVDPLYNEPDRRCSDAKSIGGIITIGLLRLGVGVGNPACRWLALLPRRTHPQVRGTRQLAGIRSRETTRPRSLRSPKRNEQILELLAYIRGRNLCVATWRLVRRVSKNSAASGAWHVFIVRLRPSRHARPMPGVRDGNENGRREGRAINRKISPLNFQIRTLPREGKVLSAEGKKRGRVSAEC